METRIPPNVETRAAAPTVRTGGEPATAPVRGNLEAPAAAPSAVCGCRIGCGLDDFTNRGSIVHIEHPAPIIPEPQPLPNPVPPHNRRDAFHGMIGGSRIQLGKLACGLGAAPVIQLHYVFDDHARIIPARENRSDPRPTKPNFSKSQLSIHNKPRENRRKDFRLDPKNDDVIVHAWPGDPGRGNRVTPSGETR